MSFIETCNTWDTAKWGHTWNPPEVVNGEWICNFPAGVVHNVQAVRLKPIGYGRFKVKFRTSGPRVPGTNYFVFLYNASPHNELDIPELYGAHESNVLSISYFRNGVSGYWYFDSGAMNFEDGKLHIWEFKYTKERLEFLLDGVLLFEFDEDPANPILPVPPMQFIIGGSGKGTSTADFQFIIDQIEYNTDVKPDEKMSISSILAPIAVGGLVLLATKED